MNIRRHYVTFERPNERPVTLNMHAVEGWEHRRAWHADSTMKDDTKRVTTIFMKSGREYVVYANPDRLALLVGAAEYNPMRGATVGAPVVQRVMAPSKGVDGTEEERHAAMPDLQRTTISG